MSPSRPVRSAIIASVALIGATLAACRATAPSTTPPPAAGPGPSARLASSGDPLPAGVTDEMIAAGRSLFNGGSCTRCHGLDGQGGRYGPALTDESWLHVQRGDYPALVALITSGVPAEKQKLPTSSAQFAMKPRGGMTYSDEQVAALAAYVWSLSRSR